MGLGIRRRLAKASGLSLGLASGCTAIVVLTALVLFLHPLGRGAAPGAQPGGDPLVPPGAPAPAQPGRASPSGTAAASDPATSPGGQTGFPAGRASSTTGGTAGGSPTEGTASPSSGSQPSLTATYRTESTDLLVLGYRGAVVITNPATKTVDGWTVTITVPPLASSVSAVSGASARRNGATWTFVPVDATRQISPGGSVRLSFQVNGVTLASAPTACTVDGRPCAGIPS
jgi:hypothetical protein